MQKWSLACVLWQSDRVHCRKAPVPHLRPVRWVLLGLFSTVFCFACLSLHRVVLPYVNRCTAASRTATSFFLVYELELGIALGRTFELWALGPWLALGAFFTNF
jgi:hypothetical protein